MAVHTPALLNCAIAQLTRRRRRRRRKKRSSALALFIARARERACKHWPDGGRPIRCSRKSPAGRARSRLRVKLSVTRVWPRYASDRLARARAHASPIDFSHELTHIAAQRWPIARTRQLTKARPEVAAAAARASPRKFNSRKALWDGRSGGGVGAGNERPVGGQLASEALTRRASERAK